MVFYFEKGTEDQTYIIRVYEYSLHIHAVQPVAYFQKFFGGGPKKNSTIN